MSGPSPRADDYGTALNQARPWLMAMAAVTDAARDLLDGTCSMTELARALAEYDAETAALTEPGEETPPGRGGAYPGLSDLRYPG